MEDKISKKDVCNVVKSLLKEREEIYRRNPSSFEALFGYNEALEDILKELGIPRHYITIYTQDGQERVLDFGSTKEIIKKYTRMVKNEEIEGFVIGGSNFSMAWGKIREEEDNPELSNCCGAPILMPDICSDCYEHCSPATTL